MKKDKKKKDKSEKEPYVTVSLTLLVAIRCNIIVLDGIRIASFSRIMACSIFSCFGISQCFMPKLA